MSSTYSDDSQEASTRPTWSPYLFFVYNTLAFREESPPIIRFNRVYTHLFRELSLALENRFFHTTFPWIEGPGHACGLHNEDTKIWFLYFRSHSNPVFFLQVNDDVNVHDADRRDKADREMNAMFQQTNVLTLCKLPRLWAVSTFGTSLRIYCVDIKEKQVLPPEQPGEYSADAGEWTVDLFSEEGCEKMHQISRDIKDMCSKFL